jgi:nitrogen regulatory protein PII
MTTLEQKLINLKEELDANKNYRKEIEILISINDEDVDKYLEIHLKHCKKIKRMITKTFDYHIEELINKRNETLDKLLDLYIYFTKVTA